MFTTANADIESFATAFEHWFADMREGVADALCDSDTWTIVEHGTGDAISVTRTDTYDLEFSTGKKLGRTMTVEEKWNVTMDGDHRLIQIHRLDGQQIEPVELSNLIDAAWRAYCLYKTGGAARVPSEVVSIAA